MILKNCFGSTVSVGSRLPAIGVTACLACIRLLYPRVTKKKLSPILLILISAVLGILVFGT